MLTFSMDNEATMKWNALAKSPEEFFLSNPTSKNSQMVKITYLPFLFIECLEFSKMYCNLFYFEIQIILAKVGFYFYFL